MNEDLAYALRSFGLAPDTAIVEPWGGGHIHETLRAAAPAGERLVLQRINDQVFPDPVAVTESIRRVTGHLNARPDRQRAPCLVEADDGAVCVEAPGGTFWRAYRFIEGTRTFDVVESTDMARRAAFAFGAFQRDLADLPPPRLPETIPAFHDTPARFRALRDAVEADDSGRVAPCGVEIERAFARESLAPVLTTARDAGDLPERVTHNDTKLDNILFDSATGEAVCAIDLDTVMPGVGPFDFGDMVRTMSCHAAEDERDLSKVEADPDLVVALAEGYLRSLGEIAGPVERELLVISGEVLTFTMAIRFLADFLRGDVYYRTARPDQNLDRARAQLKLLDSLTRRREELEKRVARLS
ncbi:MAG: phosphotransferase [Planctomycetota bacterium]